MKVEHDLSNAERGPVVTIPPGKIRITIRIDDDVLSWFKEQVNLAGGGNYQTLMNQALRTFIESKTEPLEATLRRVIREELQTAPGRERSLDRSQPSVIADSGLPISLNHSVKSRIADLCRRWHISRLALFGSTIRGDHRPDSDIDVLVEFEPGHVPGFDFITIQDELTEIFGRRVDLHTPSTLSRYFRDDVLDRAKTVYDAA